MRLLRSSKKDLDQDKDGEDVPKLESVEVLLIAPVTAKHALYRIDSSLS